MTRLWLPPLSLTECTRGLMVRSTVGVPLLPTQRFNHYPATPLCSISWWFSGEVEMLTAGQPVSLEAVRSAVPARCAFSGPHTRPTVSWSSGEAHGMMLLLLPDAVQQLTGIDPGHWTNTLVDVAEVLPVPWQRFCKHVSAAHNDDERIRRIEAFLSPLWRAARPARALGANRYSDWVQGLALRAATSHVGRGVRQIERRIRLWAGMPMRELRGFGRAERMFFAAMAIADGQKPKWSELAVETGYSDQSHLCRESRRITGCTPEELLHRIASDEGFWPYRIWQ